METRPKVNLAQSNSSSDTATPLEKHIDYFGGYRPKGEGISYTSNMQQNRRLGDSQIYARVSAAVVNAGAGIKIHKCPFSMFQPKEAVGVLNHSHHTGIYKLDGTIDEDVWDELCLSAKDNADGVAILTKNDFTQFLAMRRQKENSTDKFGKVASNGEWSGYWSKFGTVDKSGVEYVTLKNLRIFYEDSAKVGIEVEERVRNGI